MRVTSPAAVLAILLTAACVTLSSCSGPTTAGGPATAVPQQLRGWKLTLPVAGDNGGAALVDPAALTPPWLTQGADGSLAFWAPAGGATTPNSDHARTELDSVQNFPAGAGPRTLTASVAVTQIPVAGGDVIIGQIHGAGDISSVPFVMLHYTAGTVHVVVKKQRAGSSATKVELLTGVPLGARFDFSIRDNGDGGLTLGATYGSQNVTKTAAVPDGFRGATVRFQAGAYQQSDSTTAAADDGARVTFYALSS